jgi:MoaA/NifB/PqqE/SkfB family radical SAM enzyme
MKRLRTPGYNYNFDPKTGLFIRWGHTYDEDPFMSPYGPEIADIEISTVCSGIRGKPCKYCYKSNTSVGQNMSLETFKKVFHNLPKNIMQIAFGIGDVDGNPDMLKIFEYCRAHSVVPNVTINGDRLTTVIVHRLVNVCGAIAVSNHDKDVCYNAVKTLTDAGMEQVNIHQVVSKETINDCYEVIYDATVDPRLKKLNAIVFLSLKNVGRGKSMTTTSLLEFKSIVVMALMHKIRFGFDSCSCNKFLNVIRGTAYENLSQFAEPCESTLFSIYIDVEGKVYPCSFCESGLLYIGDATTTPVMELWGNPVSEEFRQMLKKCGRSCPVHMV